MIDSKIKTIKTIVEPHKYPWQTDFARNIALIIFSTILIIFSFVYYSKELNERSKIKNHSGCKAWESCD